MPTSPPVVESNDIAVATPWEDLAGAARVAGDLAQRHCSPHGGASCGWYHASWPVLRALGVFNSPGSDDDFVMRAIGDELARGATRVLVSGAADAGMLARVTSNLGLGRQVEITVLDKCRTPLELCQLHARQVDHPIEIVCADVLEFESEQPFDLICTHSFLTYFPPTERKRLVQRWHALLRPGGCVITAQRVRPGESEEITRFQPAEVERLAAAAECRAITAGADIGIAPAAARELARGYGEHHATHLIAFPQALADLFQEAGFRLEEFAPPGDESRERDRPGAPANVGSCRWRILARRA